MTIADPFFGDDKCFRSRVEARKGDICMYEYWLSVVFVESRSNVERHEDRQKKSKIRLSKSTTGIALNVIRAS